MTNQVRIFLRFLVVGGSFSLLFSVVTSALISFANTPPFVTTVVVYLLCIPAAFAAQKHYAFKVTDTKRAALIIYAATQVGSLALMSAITTQFVTRMFWVDTAIMLVTASGAAVISFLIGRFVTFRPTA